MARGRSAEEIEELLGRYRTSGLTQAEFCRRSGMSLSTLDRYLHNRNNCRLVRVQLSEPQQPGGGFVLVLSNGRRIESGWQFGDSELTRLIRIAEAV